MLTAHSTVRKTVVLACMLALTSTHPLANSLSQSENQRRALEALLLAPHSQDHYAAYLATLPRRDLIEDGTTIKRFAVEGDLVLNEDDMRAYIEGLAWKTGSGPQPELKVMNLNQKDEYWKKRSIRQLKYAIARSQFSDAERYDELVEDMKAATVIWELACRTCDVDFQHVQDRDMATNFPQLLNAGVITFLVRPGDTGANIADAFFPNYGKKARVIVLGQRFFHKVPTKTALASWCMNWAMPLVTATNMCAELQGCATSEDDGNWRRLSEYDSASIMNYICDGTEVVRTALSERDIASHTALYEPLNEEINPCSEYAPSRCALHVS